MNRPPRDRYNDWRANTAAHVPGPPSAVERLAALEDPVIAARIKAWDEHVNFGSLYRAEFPQRRTGQR